MQVWEKDSFAAIDFSASDIPAKELGYIIENDVIRDALWQAVDRQLNVELIDEPCTLLAQGELEAWLSFERRGSVTTRLVIGADGANSWLRQQCKVPLTFWDYQHTAMVATVRTQHHHQAIARQIFTPDGPLAFLPLAEPDLCSIVWSMAPEKSDRLTDSGVSEFDKALTMAFDHRLGLCHRESSLQKIPLRMRYAQEFAGRRFALIGDAAHTIHPLAGQGVNLGLGDAKTLAQTLIDLDSRQEDIGLYRNLRAWERARKAQAQQLIAGMEFLKQLFSGRHPVKKLFRGLGISVTNILPGLKQRWMKQAMGLTVSSDRSNY